MESESESESELDSALTDNIYVLNIGEEAQVEPSLQSRILISKLVKLCLTYLYGGSKSQRYVW